MASKSPTKKLTRIVSRGDLTAKQALNILSEIQLEEYNKEQENEIKKQEPQLHKPKTPKLKEANSEIVNTHEPEVVEETLEESDFTPGEMTQGQIARENMILQKAENDIEELQQKIEEKEIIFNKLLLELKRMAYIFNKAQNIDTNTALTVLNDEPKVCYLIKIV